MNNTKEPLVTVGISAYNHEKYVEQAVMSLVNQTYKKIEIIVIDDGSTDNTPNIIEKLSKQFGFKFIRQENRGLPFTLNRIIGLAKGKYITGCASDDYMPLDKVEKQVAFLEGHPEYHIIAGHAITIDKDNNILSKPKLANQGTIINFEDLFLSKKGFAAGTVMIKTDIFNKVGLYNDEYPIEDRYMWLKITNKGYLIFVNNDYYSYYRKHDTNISNNYKWRITNLKKILDIYSNHPLYEKAKYFFNIYQIKKFSIVNKKIALKLIFSTIPSLKRAYISGVIKLFIPKFICNYLYKGVV